MCVSVDLSVFLCASVCVSVCASQCLCVSISVHVEKAGLKLNIQKTKIMASGPITSWQIDGETMETVTDFIFLGSKITADGDYSHEIKRCLLLERKAITNLDGILKIRGITLPTKVCLVKAIVFPVVMYGWIWELDYKESWALKNWCFWTLMLEKTLESPLDCKAIQPVHPKGDQSWIFIGRTDAEAETPILWLPDAKSWVIGKDPDAGKDWRQEEKGMTEDEMVGWHHWLNGHEFEWALVVGDGQGSLSCCSPWGCKELNMTEWLNWAELKVMRRRTGEYGRKTEGFALGWRLRKQRVEDRNDCYDKIIIHLLIGFQCLVHFPSKIVLNCCALSPILSWHLKFYIVSSHEQALTLKCFSFFSTNSHFFLIQVLP